MIEAFRTFAPPRSYPERFAAVAVGEYGTHVAWSDEMDVSATTLWRLAQEQSGATITAEAFRPLAPSRGAWPRAGTALSRTVRAAG